MPIEKRLAVSQIIFDILRGWNINEINQINLLGFPKDTKPIILKRYQHDTPLPDDEETIERMTHIWDIANYLSLQLWHG